jgi:hypothetical protein
MRERASVVTDEEGREHHPAFGVASIHRIQSSPGEPLFQSDLQHREYIRVEVHEGTRSRDLKHDWVYPGKRVCEFSMSMSQFASFVASGGTEGVPCTINFTGGGSYGTGSRPGLYPESRLLLTSEEVRGAAARAYSRIQEHLEKYEVALKLSGKGSAALQREALSGLRSSVQNASLDVAYAAQCLDEHAEEVVEKSRADVEAMVVRMTERAGIPADQVQAIGSGE